MRFHFRVPLAALLACALAVVLAPAAAQAAFGIEGFTATNCKAAAKGCAGTEVPTSPPFEAPYWFPKEPTHKEAAEQGFTQAGGRVPNGVTDFKINTTGSYPNAKPEGEPVDHVRVDVASGLATAPAAVPTCAMAEFGATEPLPGTGFYPAPTCAKATEIGSEKVTVYVKAENLDLPLEGVVYNLVQPEGLASFYGAALKLPIVVTAAVLKFEYFPFLESIGKAPPKKVQEEAEAQQYYAHSLVKGSVEWGQESKGTGAGDYHDYFEVEVSTALPLISSRQLLVGTSGNGAFITNATSCPGDNTTYVTLENTAKEVVRKSYTTPIGLKGCNLSAEKPELEKEGITGIEQLSFSPSFAFTSGSSLSDQPNQVTTEVSVPNEPTKIAPSQLQTASVTLPEGMTLNPSAAHGLEACTPAQARIHSPEFGVACPAGSEVGTVSLNVPTLPNGSFTGSMYLGGPESGPITAPPYTLYVVANSARYGVSVRVKAEVIPNPVTGQLTTVFNENPEQPFTNLTLHFNRGALTSVANPLICGTPTGSTSFTPVAAGAVPTATAAFGVPITGCAPSIPFAPTQGVEYENANAGAHTSYALSLTRPEGQQYLQKVRTSLPLGVVGEIPTVTQCAEAQANTGTCPASSRIGSATTQSGSGSAPFTNTGTVYLTGPYQGAPYGLSIVVPAIAGPFNFGPIVTRSTINIDQKTARVTAETVLPTIVAGIPLRLRSLNVNINRQGFALNPTNCEVQPEGTSSTLTSTFGAVTTVNTPFQAEGCSALGFKPTFASSTSGKPTKANGASLTTKITMPSGDANIKYVKVTLPKQLPSRGSTLKKACLEAVFKANPYSCSPESNVGSATVVTPTLPGKLHGPAYLVSRGGAAFPNLELVLEDQGVRVVLEGNTDIKNGITTTTFATNPDVPVSSVEVSLPQGPHSALANFGSLCAPSLVIPTQMIAQNGKTFKQNTKLEPIGCPVQIVGHKVAGRTAYLTIKTFEAGRISGSGSGLKTVAKHLNSASNATSLNVSLANGQGRPTTKKIRVGFFPKKKGAATSTAFITLRFK